MTIMTSYSLQSHHSFGFPTHCQNYLSFDSVDSAIATLSTLRSQNQPIYILGEGYNVVFTSDFPGTIVRNTMTGIKIIDEDAHSTTLLVRAGENWDQLVAYCVERQLAGIENLSYIPGSVGAAPVQNIGAYGAELKDVFISLNAICLATGTMQAFQRSDCAFNYRESRFKHEKNAYLITDVTLRLQKKFQPNMQYPGIATELNKKNITHPTLADMRHAVIALRQRKIPDPAQIANAGSFFKNPVLRVSEYPTFINHHPGAPIYPLCAETFKVSAAWLIEQCDLKGMRHGEVGVSDQHALVLVHYGEGNPKDLLTLIEHIQKTVDRRFNIRLEPEVQIVHSS